MRLQFGLLAARVKQRWASITLSLVCRLLLPSWLSVKVGSARFGICAVGPRSNLDLGYRTAGLTEPKGVGFCCRGRRVQNRRP